MRLRCDPGMAELDRIEGHQKLFRSLCVLSPFLIAADIPAPGRGATAAALWGWTGALGTISLWPVLLWTTAATSTLVFFWLYLRHRMRFTRRLYELAVVASLPKDQAVDLHASLFSDSGLWLRKGRNELLRKADHKTGSAPLRRR